MRIICGVQFCVGQGVRSVQNSHANRRERVEDRRVWSCIQERPSNGVLRVTEVTVRALFFFPFRILDRDARGEQGQEKQREKVNPGKRKRVCRNSGYWLYRPFEFIYFSFTRGATPAFSRSRTKPPLSPHQSLSIFFFHSRSVSLLLFWHFYSTTASPVFYVARIHFAPLQPSTHPIAQDLSRPLFPSVIYSR